MDVCPISRLCASVHKSPVPLIPPRRSPCDPSHPLLLLGLVGEAQGLHALDLAYVYIIGGVLVPCVPHITCLTLRLPSRRPRRRGDGRRDLAGRYLFLTKTWKSIWVSRARERTEPEMLRVRDRLWNLYRFCAFALLFFSFCLSPSLSHTLPSTSHSLFDGGPFHRVYIDIYIYG